PTATAPRTAPNRAMSPSKATSRARTTRPSRATRLSRAGTSRRSRSTCRTAAEQGATSEKRLRLPGHGTVGADLRRGRQQGAWLGTPLGHEHHAGRYQREAGEDQVGEFVGGAQGA